MENYKSVLLELLEHTKDCDYNRAQHFALYNTNKIIQRHFDIAQIFLVLSMICLYCISYEFRIGSESNAGFIIPIIGLFTALITIIMYICNYAELKWRHWSAAHSYERLYRRCQFLLNEPILRNNYYALVTEVKAIASELNALNEQSPHLTKRAYGKVKDSLENKEYPAVERIIHLSVQEIDSVISAIKQQFTKYRIGIYVYGSCIFDVYYRDIDIAVIVFESTVNKLELEKIACQIEMDFLRQKVYLDITIITEDDLENSRYVPLLQNICKGKCEYQSDDIDKKASDYCSFKTKELSGESIVDTFNKSVQKAYDMEDCRSFIVNLYYYYYHIAADFLLKKGVDWDCEDNMIVCLYDNTKGSQKYELLFEQLILLKKIKNRINFEQDIKTTDVDMKSLLAEQKRFSTLAA